MKAAVLLIIFTFSLPNLYAQRNRRSNQTEQQICATTMQSADRLFRMHGFRSNIIGRITHLLGAETVESNICNSLTSWYQNRGLTIQHLNQMLRYNNYYPHDRQEVEYIYANVLRLVWPEFTQNCDNTLSGDICHGRKLESLLHLKLENNNSLEEFFSELDRLMHFAVFRSLEDDAKLELFQDHFSTGSILYHLESGNFRACYNFIANNSGRYRPDLYHFSEKCSIISRVANQGHEESLRRCVSIYSHMSIILLRACGQIETLTMLERDYNSLDFLAYERCVGAQQDPTRRGLITRPDSLTSCTEASNMSRFRAELQTEWVNFVKNSCELDSGDFSLSNLNGTFICRSEWNSASLWIEFASLKHVEPIRRANVHYHNP